MANGSRWSAKIKRAAPRALNAWAGYPRCGKHPKNHRRGPSPPVCVLIVLVGVLTSAAAQKDSVHAVACGMNKGISPIKSGSSATYEMQENDILNNGNYRSSAVRAALVASSQISKRGSKMVALQHLMDGSSRKEQEGAENEARAQLLIDDVRGTIGQKGEQAMAAQEQAQEHLRGAPAPHPEAQGARGPLQPPKRLPTTARGEGAAAAANKIAAL
jgi:hypothetical protein